MDPVRRSGSSEDSCGDVRETLEAREPQKLFGGCTRGPSTVRAEQKAVSNFIESVVEEASLAWVESLGYAIKHGPGDRAGRTFPSAGTTEKWTRRHESGS